MIVGVLGVGTAGAQVITDGSLGRATALLGPNYGISADLGRQSGPNLFHSFRQFEVGKGEVAVFSGPAEVQNILARVTGGSPSSIDGTLRSTIPGANLYLVNPWGWLFGANARLDVSGSFVATTADYLQHTDGTHWVARGTLDGAVTTAPVERFGFLSQDVGSIKISGSILKVGSGKGIQLVGGELGISAGAQLQASDGLIGLTSVQQPGEVGVSASPEAPAVGGAIQITSSAKVNADGPSGGRVVVRGGTLVVDNGTLKADTTGTGTGGAVDIALRGDLTLQKKARISTETSGNGAAGRILLKAATIAVLSDSMVSASTTSGNGNAGNIVVETDALTLLGGTSVQSDFRTGILGTTEASANGKAGTVDLRVNGPISIKHGAGIGAYSRGRGAAGAVSVKAGSLVLDGEGNIYFGAGISTAAYSVNGGTAGNLDVQVSGLAQLYRGANLEATSYGTGDAGSIHFQAGALKLDGAGFSTGLNVDSYSTESGAGWAGHLSVEVGGVLSILNGGTLSDIHFGVAKLAELARPGSIRVRAGSLTMDGAGGSVATSIAGASYNVGRGAGAGDVDVEVLSTINILNGALVSSATYGLGEGGSVRVVAQSMNIRSDNRSAGVVTSTFGGRDSKLPPGRGGNAGKVELKISGTLEMGQNARIVSDTLARTGLDNRGNAGSVYVEAGSLTLDSGSGGVSSPRISSETSAPTGAGHAGDVQVQVAEQLVLRNGAAIQSSSYGDGAGGSVSVKAGSIRVSGESVADGSSGIGSQSQSVGRGGNAGAVTVEASGLVELSQGGQITSVAFGSGDAGHVVVHAGQLTVTGGSADHLDSAIASGSVGSGRAGTVAVEVSGSAILSAGGLVDSTTYGSGGVAGSVQFLADSLRIDGAGWNALTGISSQQQGGGVGSVTDLGHVSVGVRHGIELVNGGKISATTLGLMPAGSVQVTAESLVADGVLSGVFGETRSTGAGGDGGTVDVTVTDSILLRRGGQISTSTFGSGRAGRVHVSTRALTVEGDPTGGFGGTGIFSETLSVIKKLGGNAGTVSVEVSGSATLRDYGQISSSTAGTGAAGAVQVTAGSLSAVGPGAGVYDFSGTSGVGGDAGDIRVAVSGWVELRNGAQISSTTFGQGQAGLVQVSAGNLVADASAGTLFTGIDSSTLNSGLGGNARGVDVTVSGDLQILRGAQLAAATLGLGHAGTINLRADHLQISGDASTGVFASSEAVGSGGDGGDVRIAAGQVSISGGIISARTTSSGDGGVIQIHAGEVRLDSQGAISSESQAGGRSGKVSVEASGPISLVQGSSISTAATKSSSDGILVRSGTEIRLRGSEISARAGRDGGLVAVEAPSQIVLVDSTISTRSGGSGGNITIDPELLILNRSFISADAVQGDGGNITIRMNYLVASPESRITASSQFGASGQISLLGPAVDLTGGLVKLNSGLLVNDTRLLESCLVRAEDMSTFLRRGRGGLPFNPEDPLPAFMEAPEAHK